MSATYSLTGKRVFVAGHRGMVGSAIVRRLASENCEILTVNRTDVDLRDQVGVRAWLADRKPHAVVLAAAKVGADAVDERGGEGVGSGVGAPTR
jgi:GDP-L-fucose synthase